jgi:hypothetical protein
VSIIVSKPVAIEATEAADAVKPTILPAAVFIIVEILLAAETISVILFDELDPRNSWAGAIAILLSVALLANLGLVCSAAAGFAADAIRRSNRARALAPSGWFSEVSVPAERPVTALVPASG